jgi:hypothetical protein
VSFHDTVPPTPVPPPRRPSRKRYNHRPCAHLGWCHDVRPAKRVSSVTSGPVRPSPSLCRHPGRCNVVPSTVETQINETSSHRPLCGLRSSISRALHPSYGWQTNKSFSATTLEDDPGRAHDSPRRPPGARFARTTIDSTILCAMPPYVALRPCVTTVNRLPLAYKRRRRSPGHGGTTDSYSLAHFRLHPRYWHFASINPQGPGGFSSSPALLVDPLYEHHGTPKYSATSASCWTYGPWPQPG